ncbi:Cob(I)yrinic acid a,c-diamide adenosyltransferase [Anatilimnocola aggregata]|uniref:Corrinoid adenosyltransferase n=1 Tax=Anatilimnocola aggregata TaxID=2528021 RepID=A0A517Y7X5_9BACT|nr:cob(I)yrinic acid a,c-diamide adenosyltransferase [Anatilimnocola aggregata]QDU26333.1 Cob(I)yrinic acid a,c-diamide adenosyltransferase [Anatilimnocola aggregata]
MTMKIYTKTGDDGETGLFGGPRVRKDDPRIEAYGTVDELNALLGLARCEVLPLEIEATLARVQNDLFAVGAELASPDPQAMGTAWIGDSQIAHLEQAIDAFDDRLPPLKKFILPAGNRGACTIHVARGVCRRAERCVVTLADLAGVTVSAQLIRYLNRLGDYLFVAARAANVLAGEAEIPWEKPG